MQVIIKTGQEVKLVESCSFHFFEFVALAVSCPSFKGIDFAVSQDSESQVELGTRPAGQSRSAPWDAMPSE